MGYAMIYHDMPQNGISMEKLLINHRILALFSDKPIYTKEKTTSRPHFGVPA